MFCPECGAEAPDDGVFCGNCGANLHGAKPPVTEEPTNPTEQEQSTEAPDGKLRCPKCNSTDLELVHNTVTVESGGGYKGGRGCLGLLLFGPLGLLCGLCRAGKKSTTATYTNWVCKSCGNQFRDPREVEKEERENKKLEAITSHLVGPIVFIFGLFIYNMFGNRGTWIYAIGGTCIIIGFMQTVADVLVVAIEWIARFKEKNDKDKDSPKS